MWFCLDSLQLQCVSGRHIVHFCAYNYFISYFLYLFKQFPTVFHIMLGSLLLGHPDSSLIQTIVWWSFTRNALYYWSFMSYCTSTEWLLTYLRYILLLPNIKNPHRHLSMYICLPVGDYDLHIIILIKSHYGCQSVTRWRANCVTFLNSNLIGCWFGR